MDSIDEAVLLGCFAAYMDVFSTDPYLTDHEREQIFARADRYRDLQLVALVDPYDAIKEAAWAVLAEIEETQPTERNPR